MTELKQLNEGGQQVHSRRSMLRVGLMTAGAALLGASYFGREDELRKEDLVARKATHLEPFHQGEVVFDPSQHYQSAQNEQKERFFSNWPHIKPGNSGEISQQLLTIDPTAHLVLAKIYENHPAIYEKTTKMLADISEILRGEPVEIISDEQYCSPLYVLLKDIQYYALSYTPNENQKHPDWSVSDHMDEYSQMICETLRLKKSEQVFHVNDISQLFRTVVSLDDIGWLEMSSGRRLVGRIYQGFILGGGDSSNLGVYLTINRAMKRLDGTLDFETGQRLARCIQEEISHYKDIKSSLVEPSINQLSRMPCASEKQFQRNVQLLKFYIEGLIEQGNLLPELALDSLNNSNLFLTAQTVEQLLFIHKYTGIAQIRRLIPGVELTQERFEMACRTECEELMKPCPTVDQRVAFVILPAAMDNLFGDAVGETIGENIAQLREKGWRVNVFEALSESEVLRAAQLTRQRMQREKTDLQLIAGHGAIASKNGERSWQTDTGKVDGSALNLGNHLYTHAYSRYPQTSTLPYSELELLDLGDSSLFKKLGEYWDGPTIWFSCGGASKNNLQRKSVAEVCARASGKKTLAAEVPITKVELRFNADNSFQEAIFYSSELKVPTLAF